MLRFCFHAHQTENSGEAKPTSRFIPKSRPMYYSINASTAPKPKTHAQGLWAGAVAAIQHTAPREGWCPHLTEKNKSSKAARVATRRTQT